MHIVASLLLLFGFAVHLATAGVSPTEQALQEGRRMTADQAAQIEQALEANPEDLMARARLLGYYTPVRILRTNGTAREPVEGAEQNRLRHIVWLVSNHPEAELAGRPEAVFVDRASPEWRQLVNLWLEQAAKFPDNAAVLKHAAQFTMSAVPEKAAELLRRAIVLAPEDADAARQLGALLASFILDPAMRNAPAGVQARADLEACAGAALCGSAGMALAGSSLPGSPQVKELARTLLLKAQAMAPNDPAWAYYLDRLSRTEAPPPPYQPPTGIKAIRVGGNVQAAKLLSQTQPSYPPLAKQARIQATVRFNVTIGEDGTVRDMQLISGHPLLVEAARDALKQWTYRPTLVNGEPVQVITTVDINFTLNDAPPRP